MADWRDSELRAVQLVAVGTKIFLIISIILYSTLSFNIVLIEQGFTLLGRRPAALGLAGPSDPQLLGVQVLQIWFLIWDS